MQNIYFVSTLSPVPPKPDRPVNEGPPGACSPASSGPGALNFSPLRALGSPSSGKLGSGPHSPGTGTPNAKGPTRSVLNTTSLSRGSVETTSPGNRETGSKTQAQRGKPGILSPETRAWLGQQRSPEHKMEGQEGKPCGVHNLIIQFERNRLVLLVPLCLSLLTVDLSFPLPLSLSLCLSHICV